MLFGGAFVASAGIGSEASPLRENPFSEATRLNHAEGSELDVAGRELRRQRAAVDGEAERSYGDELARAQELAELLDGKTPAELEERFSDLVRLYNQDGALAEANARLVEDFAAVRASLVERKMDRVFLERHDAAVAEHEARSIEIAALLAELRAASGEPLARQAALEMVCAWFSLHPAEVRPALGNAEPNPPTRQPIENRIELAELGLDSRGIRLPPTPPARALRGDPEPADLAETPDARFAAAIQGLAASLEGSALRIFNFVRNEIEFDPYVGSRRGAEETLRLRAGNDMDQASLLIALLRVSGIPARYATGRVEMDVEAACSWLGTESPAAAGSILATAGMGGATIYNGSEVVALQCNRVWVEAHLPFSEYRGAGAASGEELWVPLDPAFKRYHNRIGVDPLLVMEFNPDSFIREYFQNLELARIEDVFAMRISAALGAQSPAVTLRENSLARAIARSELPWLPASVPNRLLQRGETFSEIPQERRYGIRFLIQSAGSTLDHSVSLPEIAGRQVTVSYIGATAADVNLIAASGGLFGVSQPWLVKVKPQLRIDGCVVATGSGDIGLGRNQTSRIFFTTPSPESETASIENTLIAGNYEGHAIDTGRVRVDPGNRELACQEDFAGGFLHKLGMRYLELNDRTDRRLASMMQGVVWKGVSNAILSQQVRVIFSGSTPLTFRYAGLSVDADRAGASFFSAYGNGHVYQYGRIRGAQSSQNENLIFETQLGRESVSTIKILSLSALLGIPIYEITPSNAGTVLPLLAQPVAVRNDVIAQLNLGKHVTIPRSQISYFDWGGTGWMQLDPVNGSGGYIISGGISGGATAEEEEAGPGCERVDNVKFEPEAPGNTYSNCQDEPVTIIVTLTGLDEECETVSTRQERVTFTPSSLPTGLHQFRFGSPGDCGCAVDTVTVVIKGSAALFHDTDGRLSAAGILEISNPLSENIRGRLAGGPPTTRWVASAGATPSELTGTDVTFDVAVPPSLVRSSLPNLITIFVAPPAPVSISVEDIAEACGVDVRIYPFSSREFSFAIAIGPSAKKSQSDAADAGQSLGETVQGLESIVRFLDNAQEQLEALRTLARTMRSPVEPPKFAVSSSVSIKDVIAEDKSSNLVTYTLDVGGNVDIGVSWKFPVLTTAMVAVPPPLAEAAIEVMMEGKVGARLAGIADFQRASGWLKAIYPQATLFINVGVGLGARVSVASGIAEISVEASTGLQMAVKVYPQIAGWSLQLGGEWQVEIGGLTAGYKVGALWGLWTSSGSWKLYDPIPYPAEPRKFTILQLPP